VDEEKGKKRKKACKIQSSFHLGGILDLYSKNINCTRDFERELRIAMNSEYICTVQVRCTYIGLYEDIHMRVVASCKQDRPRKRKETKRKRKRKELEREDSEGN
jgi:transcriptional regulator of met regulon